jgi:hypothetical protein
VKSPLLVALPFGVVTPIGPSSAAAGTVALIRLAETTVKAAAAPLKSTAVAPVKLLPSIATSVPAGPLAGEKPVIAGPGLITVISKLLLLVAVPSGVVRLTGPLLAPVGTTASISLFDATLKEAATLLKATLVVPWSQCPLIVTVVPAGPSAGKKLEIVGVLAGARAREAEARDAGSAASITAAASIIAGAAQRGRPRDGRVSVTLPASTSEPAASSGSAPARRPRRADARDEVAHSRHPLVPGSIVQTHQSRSTVASRRWEREPMREPRCRQQNHHGVVPLDSGARRR